MDRSATPRATLAAEIAKTDAYPTSRDQRKKVEMLFAHLNQTHSEARPAAAARPFGARDELHLAAIAQNLRKPAPLIRELIRSTKCPSR